MEVGNQLVEIRQRDAEADGLAVHFHDRHPLRIDQRLEALGHVRDFRLGKRDEAPVFRPGVVEDRGDGIELLVVAGLVEIAHAHRRRLAPIDHATGRLRQFVLDVVHVGDHILRLGVALLLDAARRIARVVRHHQHRRRVVTVDQQPGLLVDRQAERSDHATLAACAQPGLGGLEQGCEHRCVVFGREHAEMADLRILHQLIDLRADAPDILPIAAGQPELAFGVREIGILLR